MRRRAAATAIVTASVSAVLAASCSSAPVPDRAVQTGSLPAVSPAPSTAPTTTSPGATGATTKSPNGGSTPATAGTTPGSTPGATRTAGTCPDKTELTIRTNAGDKKIVGGTAWADVTLDKSAQIIITNFETPASVANSVWQPTLTGNQVGLLLYLTTKGEKLEERDYLPVGRNPNAKLQLNNVAAYSAAGREIVGGFNRTSTSVTITRIDAKQVCGTVDLAEGSGSFVATRT